MWNGEVRFEPAEILGLLVLVEQEAGWSLDTRQPIRWVTSPYSLIPHELLVYECDIRLRYPTAEGMRTARKVFGDLLARALAGRPARGLALIPPLQQSA